MAIKYEALIAAARASLAENEFWCVFHPDGPLLDTASQRFDYPVRVVCEALNADWDDLREAGFYLGRVQKNSGGEP